MSILSLSDKEKLIQAYQRRSYYFSDNVPAAFDLKEFDEFFMYSHFRDGDIRVFKNSIKTDNSIFTNTHKEFRLRSINKEKIVSLLHEGNTIIFENANFQNKYFSELAGEVSQLFDSEAWVNCYLTPPSAQGFGIHADDHDVIIIQLYGCKNWQIYIEGDQVIQVKLNENNLLYIPKGLRHKAETTDSQSLHATIGFYPVTYYSVLKDIIHQRLVEYDNIIYSHGNNEILVEIFESLSRLPTQIRLPSLVDTKPIPGILASLEQFAAINKDTLFQFDKNVSVIKHDNRLDIHSESATIKLLLSDFDFIKQARMNPNFSASSTDSAPDIDRKIRIIKQLLACRMIAFA